MRISISLQPTYLDGRAKTDLGGERVSCKHTARVELPLDPSVLDWALCYYISLLVVASTGFGLGLISALLLTTDLPQ